MVSTAGGDVYIALMGLTGSGKSTFINLISGSDLPESSGLASCTKSVAFGTTFKLGGRNIHLIDTPGFDDTDRNDADILKTIAEFLKTQFENKITLHGVIYLYRISDIRMGGVSKRSFTTLQNLCGDDSLKNVVIVTTMWGMVAPEEGEEREAQLKSNSKFFKPVLDRGAKIHRHAHNSVPSAENIIRSILNNHPQELRVQHEMVTLSKSLSDTTVGLQVESELKSYIDTLHGEIEKLRAARAKDEMTMKDVKVELKEAKLTISKVEKQLIILSGTERVWRNMAEIERVAMMFRLSREGDVGRTVFWSALGAPTEELASQLQKEFSKRPQIPLDVRDELLDPEVQQPPISLQTWIDRNRKIVENLEKVVKKHLQQKKKRWFHI